MVSYFKKRAFKKELKEHRNYGKPLEVSSQNQARIVGVITSAMYRIEVESFISRLREKGSAVITIYYDGKGVESYDTYCDKQVKWNGVPVSDVVDRFLEKKFDRLYYIDFEMASHQRYLLELSQCRLSIGNAAMSDSFDFSVEIKDNDINSLIHAMEKYIDWFS